MSEHLQPEWLNTFVEGVLPEHERIACLAHLAECARCREIVFVAQQTVDGRPLDTSGIRSRLEALVQANRGV